MVGNKDYTNFTRSYGNLNLYQSIHIQFITHPNYFTLFVISFKELHKNALNGLPITHPMILIYKNNIILTLRPSVVLF